MTTDLTYERLQDAIDAVERHFAALMSTAVSQDGTSFAAISYMNPDGPHGKFYGPNTQMVIDAAIQYADQLKSGGDYDAAWIVKDAPQPAAVPTGYRVTAFWAPRCNNAGDPCNFGAYETYEEAQAFVEWLAKGAFIGGTVVDVSIEKVYE